jgi:hypothetical protein
MRIKNLITPILLSTTILVFAGNKKTKEGITDAINAKIKQCMDNSNAPGCKDENDGKPKKNEGMEIANQYMKEQKAEKEAQEAPCKKDPNSKECKSVREYQKQDAENKTKQLGGLIGEMANVKAAKNENKLKTLKKEVKENCDKKSDGFSQELCDEAKDAYKAALKE